MSLPEALDASGRACPLFPLQLILEDELESEEGSQVSIHRLPSTAVKVNNNMLMDWEGFFPTIDAILVDSTQRLSWLDLSFNDFKLIDSVRSYTIQTHT